MAYTVMAYAVMAYIVLACIFMAHIVMAYIVMAYVVGPKGVEMFMGRNQYGTCVMQVLALLSHALKH